MRKLGNKWRKLAHAKKTRHLAGAEDTARQASAIRVNRRVAMAQLAATLPAL